MLVAVLSHAAINRYYVSMDAIRYSYCVMMLKWIYNRSQCIILMVRFLLCKLYDDADQLVQVKCAQRPWYVRNIAIKHRVKNGKFILWWCMTTMKILVATIGVYVQHSSSPKLCNICSWQVKIQNRWFTPVSGLSKILSSPVKSYAFIYFAHKATLKLPFADDLWCQFKFDWKYYWWSYISDHQWVLLLIEISEY